MPKVVPRKTQADLYLTSQKEYEMNWIIENRKDRELAWSNSWGWCSETFDTFTCYEKETFNLPIDGEWQSVSWSVEEA